MPLLYVERWTRAEGLKNVLIDGTVVIGIRS